MSDAATREPQTHTEAGEQQTGLRVSFPTRRTAISARASRRLFGLLVGKSVLETLFVVILAFSFFYATFNNSVRGAVEFAGPSRVEGWAIDDARPNARIEVHLYIDGRFVASAKADQPRPDARDAGLLADEFHGFSFELNHLGEGEHEARIYAVGGSVEGSRSTLHLVGHPLRFDAAAR